MADSEVPRERTEDPPTALPSMQDSTASGSVEPEERLPLHKAAQLLVEECRMVLPGIQALFGFQLIAVFSPRFHALTAGEKWLHLAAIGLVSMAIALIMTPAAYHLQTDPQRITARFIRMSTRLVLWSMPSLALSLCAEFYLVTRVITEALPAALLATALLAVFGVLWFVLPRASGLERALAKRQRRKSP